MNNEINIINKIAIEVKGERKSVNELLNNAVYERAFSACIRKALNEGGLNASYYGDLFSEGIELLISECIPNYRANNSDFLAYSLFIVKKRLQRVIAKKYKVIKIPDGERLKYIKAKKLINMLEISGSNYNEDEIESVLKSNGIKMKNMIRIDSYEKMESLDNYEYESSSLYESISDKKNEYNDIMKKEISSALRRLVTKVLTKHERSIVVRYFNEDKPSLTKLSKELGVTPKAISKTLRTSLIKLREAADDYCIEREDIKYFTDK